jgi:soluble lytic murein transglycosylase
LARCLEELVNYDGALQIYRSIWLNTPTSPLAAKSQERIKFLDRLSFKVAPYTPEELLKRAATLQAQNQHNDSLKTLEMIQTASVSQEMADRIAFRTGKAQYLLKRYAQAEKQFIKAAASAIPGIRSEGRFWLAKSRDRQDLKVQAFAMYMELAGEGKKQEYADDALIEAAELKRGLGQFAEAARLFDQVAKVTLESKTIAKSVWNGGWCRYLAGDYPAATEAFKNLLSDEKYREKALYWIGRGVEKGGDTASAASYFRTLTNEFPAGFYATWYREQKGVKDGRESIGNRDPLVEIPTAAGFDKPRLLASLGLIEEARVEMAAIRKKNGEKKGQFPGVARIYLEMRDYGMAIYMFIQNKPLAWTKETLPLWTFGYPRAFSQLISQNSSLNGLSEGLVYALIRAESGFSPAIKSGAGAIGLMQMMPATARMTAHEKGEFNPQRLTTPEYNIRLGTRHLHDLMKEYDGDVVYMAAAYNAGSGALGRWKKSYKGLQKDEFIESIPYQETREYVKKVYASAATYRQLYGIK